MVGSIVVGLLVGVGAWVDRGPERPAYRQYVALGDSFTAAPYVPLSVLARGCLRSTNNYPQLVAGALRIPDLRDRSCSGARTQDLPGRQLTHAGRPVPPQLSALDRRTDLVTIGIGANDERLYGRIATRCRRTVGTCRLADERAAIAGTLSRLPPALVDTVRLVQRLAPRARVVLVGYPALLPARGDCRLLPRMRPEDRATFRAANHGLSAGLRAAARDTGVEYVDVETASRGHDICSSDPWIQGRVGNARRAAAMHPLPVEQLAVARMLEDLLLRPPPRRAPVG
ncbi:SGNH/GDSL hydrolase family protein [Nocardioides korecus]